MRTEIPLPGTAKSSSSKQINEFLEVCNINRKKRRKTTFRLCYYSSDQMHTWILFPGMAGPSSSKQINEARNINRKKVKINSQIAIVLCDQMLSEILPCVHNAPWDGSSSLQKIGMMRDARY